MQQGQSSDRAALKATRLSAWFRRMGITYQDIALFSNDQTYSEDSLGIQALQDIPEGTTIAILPKSTVISSKTSSLGPFLEEHKIGGGLGLVFAVMYEAAQGTCSKWHGYLSSLPARENVPMFWDDEEIEMLQGTDAAAKPHQDREDTAADFNDEIVPLLGEGKHLYDPATMTLDSFRAAASWVGSRAFGIDDFHDMFNHKASIIELSGEYELEGKLFSSCEGPVFLEVVKPAFTLYSAELEAQHGACLDISSYPQNSGSEDIEDEQEGNDDEAELIRNTDEEGHAGEVTSSEKEDEETLEASEVEEDSLDASDEGRTLLRYPTKGSMLDPANFPGQDLRPHIRIIGSAREGEEVLEIVAACDLKKGQEIFNTFGELENTELVCKYGFALPDNPFNSVHLDKAIFLEEAEKMIGAEDLLRRRHYIEAQSRLLEEDEEPFLILPAAQIGPPLLIALRLLSCTAQEFSSLESSDLGEVVQEWSSISPDHGTDPEAPLKKKQKLEATLDSNDSKPQLDESHDENAVRGSEASKEGDLANGEHKGGLQLSNMRIDPSNSWLPETVRYLLQRCIKRRIALYRTNDLLADESALAAVTAERPRLEKQLAQIAALTLVISEKRILQGALRALNGQTAV